MLEDDKHNGKNKAGNGRWSVQGRTVFFFFVVVVIVVFLGFLFVLGAGVIHLQNAMINVGLAKNEMMLENVHERDEGASLATL